MKVVLFLSLSAALLFTVVFTHHGGEHDFDPSDDQEQSKRGSYDGDSDGDHGQHGKRKYNPHHHDHTNETLAFRKIAPANARFALKFFRQLVAKHPSENIFFSPISISIAFAMLCEGAKGKTHDQIFEGLGFNSSENSEEIHNGFREIIHGLNNPDSELQLNSANALFVAEKIKLLKPFLDDVTTNYASEVFSTDFENSDEAKKQINSYVERKTNGKIADLLSSVDRETVLMLINCIYFRGKWDKPFEEEFTKEGDFHVDENTAVTVSFMRRNGRYRALLSETLTVVEIPYKGNASALFIMSKDGNIEANLHKSTIHKWKSQLRLQSLDLQVPKLKVATTLDLKTELSELGMTDVFSDKADLSVITKEAKLKVSKALHKAVLSIDEKGTEAAGATAIEIMPMSLPQTVTYSRPFIVIINHFDTKSFLFLGKIVNPVAT